MILLYNNSYTIAASFPLQIVFNCMEANLHRNVKNQMLMLMIVKILRLRIEAQNLDGNVDGGELNCVYESDYKKNFVFKWG